jgi:hypothetical protein
MHDLARGINFTYFLLPNGLLQEVETVSDISHMDAHLTWFRIAHEKEFENTIDFENFVNHFVIRDSDGNIVSVSGTADGRHWPRREVASSKNLIGLADYHGTMTWTWLLGYFIGLVSERGYTKLQDELLNWCLVSQTRIKKSGFDEYISEIYSSGEIVHNSLYTSETPFMWGSAYIFWATSKILEAADDEVLQCKKLVSLKMENVIIIENVQKCIKPNGREGSVLSIWSIPFTMNV